jgi:hypothetical protein
MYYGQSAGNQYQEVQTSKKFPVDLFLHSKTQVLINMNGNHDVGTKYELQTNTFTIIVIAGGSRSKQFFNLR